MFRNIPILRRRERRSEMMSEIDGIKRKLENHEDRISKIEEIIFKKKKIPKIKKTLRDHILEERDKGYFSVPRTAKEVHKKLHNRYPCELNRVAVGLLRLQKNAKLLRKTSKKVGKKTHTAYVR